MLPSTPSSNVFYTITSLKLATSWPLTSDSTESFSFSKFILENKNPRDECLNMKQKASPNDGTGVVSDWFRWRRSVREELGRLSFEVLTFQRNLSSRCPV